MAGILLWVSLGFFVFMIAYKVYRINSMPLHLRWELYPLSLDPNHEHGGSFMEAVDFGKKPQEHIRMNGIKELASEVFLLKKVRLHNQYGVWPFSLAMHWGIYLMFGWIFLMLLEKAWGGFALVTDVAGLLSWALGSVGCLGLIYKRAVTEDLAAYTAPIDYFNLGFLYAIFFTGLIGRLGGTAFGEGARLYLGGSLAFGQSAIANLVWIHFGLIELFLIYMPFSRLFHYVAKYFTIDKVVWDDHLNTKGSHMEERIKAQLGYKLTWSAAHIAPGKTWAEEAAMTDAGEGRQ